MNRKSESRVDTAGNGADGAGSDDTRTQGARADDAQPVAQSQARDGAEPDQSPGAGIAHQVYDALRELAARFLRRERPGHTLQPTALVHEAYLRLADQTRVHWRSRTHFLAVGATLMRRILVDHARRRARLRHGGDLQRVTLDGADALPSGQDLALADLLALDEALRRLAELDARAAQVVELRFFAGLRMAEIAEHLQVSKRSVEGDWSHARAWLAAELSGNQ